MKSHQVNQLVAMFTKTRMAHFQQVNISEADIGYRGGYRGTERIVYSADGKNVYMTNDHYETFTEIK